MEEIELRQHAITSPVGLMPGNYVYNKHGEIHCFEWRDFANWSHPQMGGYYGFSGIPTDEPILDELGFEYEGYNMGEYEQEVFKKGDLTLIHTSFGARSFLYKGEELKYPEYAHQLQNTFWCLTGQELTINN